jgi:Ras-related protein Rab-2A
MVEDHIRTLQKMPFELMDPKLNKSDFLFKLIIIGDSAVGKSCLMQRVTTNEFIEDHEVTVGVEFGTLIIRLTDQIFKLQIWDTAGQESFKSITKIFYRGAHCVVLAYDITRLDTFLNLETWFKEVKQ